MSEFVVHCVGCCECRMCMYGPASVFHPHWGTYSVRVLTYFQCFISVQCVHAKCMSFWFDFHWFSTQLTYMFAMVARCKTVYTCDLYSRGYYLGIFSFCCREHTMYIKASKMMNDMYWQTIQIIVLLLESHGYRKPKMICLCGNRGHTT